jgi:hypothetical protein
MAARNLVLLMGEGTSLKEGLVGKTRTGGDKQGANVELTDRSAAEYSGPA